MEHGGIGQLELEGVIGFSGGMKNSLLLHPNDSHIIYPLGATVVIRNVHDNKDQFFLQGHTDRVTCIAMTKDGKYLASGQITHMGYLAPVMLWDISDLGASPPKLVHTLRLHKVQIQALAFSCAGTYLATIGGPDDNNLVVWRCEDGMAICGSPAAHDSCLTVAWFNSSEEHLATGGLGGLGGGSLRVWDFDAVNRKVRPTNVALGQNKRSFNCVAIADDDSTMYCGSTSGDVFKIDLASKNFLQLGPRKKLQQGVTSICINPKTGEVLVGSGGEEIAVLQTDNLQPIYFTKVLGGVSSLALDSHGEFFFCGTEQSNMYLVQYDQLVAELKSTCHSDEIADVCFPRGYSELFVTCSGNDIRVWHARTMSELLRIQVPNLVCNCVCLSPNGTEIVSGWSDGRVRTFGPQSGKLLYVINDAHKIVGVGNASGGETPKNGVTAVTCTNDCKRLLTGGADGQVRVWAVAKETQVMIASMKEHKGPVYQIAVKGDDSECVSASADGSCITWALAGMQSFTRCGALFAANFFKSVVYHPDESQLLTCGTDRKLTYWDVTDMAAIRIVDGSLSAECNTLDICADGRFFVSGGGDKTVKLWHYDEGSQYYEGQGHSGAIIKAVITPDEQRLVTVGGEGGIFIWKVPEEFQGQGAGAAA